MSSQPQPERFGAQGLLIAAAIFVSWSLTLLAGFAVDLTWSWTLFIWLPPAMLLRTFLHTGLFITAHDAMHGVVAPRAPRLNDALGILAVTLYALFSFSALRDKHWEHHRHPTTADDPDFHDGQHPSFWAWYTHFLRNYLSLWQLLGMAILFNVAEHLIGIPALNLILFWVVPSLLSTLQLFYFGTYRPHRVPEGGHRDAHAAQSSGLNVLWSFITCYHFGYHWEHHAYPFLPWWRLPQAVETSSS